MIAERIIAALLDSDEDLMSELGEIAVNPAIGAIKFALERGQEFNERITHPQAPGGTALDIDIKPIGQGDWALKNGSRMVAIRWIYKSHWGKDQQGGGYFFVRPEQFGPFLRELEALIAAANKTWASDEELKRIYNRVIMYRYSAPRKKHARQKYTENGLFAYMR